MYSWFVICKAEFQTCNEIFYQSPVLNDIQGWRHRTGRGNGVNHIVLTLTSKSKRKKAAFSSCWWTHRVMHGIFFYSQSKLRLNISQLALFSLSHKHKQALMESEWAEGEVKTSWWWTFPSIRVSPLRRAFKTLLHYVTHKNESKKLHLRTGNKACKKPLEGNVADENERKLPCTSAGQNVVKSSAVLTRAFLASCQCPHWWWCNRWAALHGGTSTTSTQNLLRHALVSSKVVHSVFWCENTFTSHHLISLKSQVQILSTVTLIFTGNII